VKKLTGILGLFLAVIIGQTGFASAADDALKALEGIKLEALGYIDYSNGKTPLANDKTANYNKFSLTRGYLTVKKTINPWLGVRLTTDLTQDASGEYLIRQKYLYAELAPPNFGPLTEMKTEIGLGHIPWLDFEESVNPYRAQGTMAIERSGVLNSADAGVNIRGDIKGRLADAKARTGNAAYDGHYGTWHLGVYNGSGYSAPENNDNKVIEGRLTIRPLPDQIPGLQVSYFGLSGKGNARNPISGEFPDYNVNLGMLSYEHPILILTAQYFATTGNAKGSWVADSSSSDPGAALKTDGYSIFGNLRIPSTQNRISVYARYDFFNVDMDKVIADKAGYSMIIGGLSFDLYNGNMLLADYEVTTHQDNAGTKGNLPRMGNNLGDESRFQLVYQLKF
jgi:hypothetical protein